MSKVEIELDKDSEKILNSVSPVMKNAAIIIGLKLLSKSPMYRAYISDDVPDTIDVIPGEHSLNHDLPQDEINQPTPVAARETAAPVVIDKPKPSVSWDSF